MIEHAEKNQFSKDIYSLSFEKISLLFEILFPSQQQNFKANTIVSKFLSDETAGKNGLSESNNVVHFVKIVSHLSEFQCQSLWRKIRAKKLKRIDQNKSYEFNIRIRKINF